MQCYVCRYLSILFSSFKSSILDWKVTKRWHLKKIALNCIFSTHFKMSAISSHCNHTVASRSLFNFFWPLYSVIRNNLLQLHLFGSFAFTQVDAWVDHVTVFLNCQLILNSCDTTRFFLRKQTKIVILIHSYFFLGNDLKFSSIF